MLKQRLGWMVTIFLLVGDLRDYGCVTARKDGQVVGVLSFKWGGGSGLLDRGVVAREERKRVVEDGKPISEDLMRLALAELVAEHECDLVMAEPVSERGRKYTERNGFNLKDNNQVERHGKEFYYLDDKIIEKMKEFLAQKNEGNKATEETILELRNEFDGYLFEVKSERQVEMGNKKL